MQDSGNLEPRRQITKHALQLHKEASGDESANVAEFMGALASIRHARRDYLGAEELLQKAWPFASRPWARSIIKSRGRCLPIGTRGRDGTTSKALNELIAKRSPSNKKGFGDEHQFVAEILNPTGPLYVSKGDLTQALENTAARPRHAGKDPRPQPSHHVGSRAELARDSQAHQGHKFVALALHLFHCRSQSSS